MANQRKRLWRRWGILLAVVVLGAGLVAWLLFRGILQINHPAWQGYTVRGVDVSSYQGVIDWEVLAQQNVSFAFIKATEGSSYVDQQFAENWEKAGETDLLTGAYHFFSFDSPGASQAALFLKTVPPRGKMLPPVIDVEFYADKEQFPPPAEEVLQELQEMISILEKSYGVKPILYVTKNSYQTYFSEGTLDCPLWIRSVYGQPFYQGDTPWLFWQYSNRTVLSGYQGVERYIDMNVFYSTEEELAALAVPETPAER